MNSSTHDELLERIAELWKRYPHWRLGQLVANAAGWIDQEVWDADDEKMLDGIRAHLHDRAKREQEVCAAS